MKENLYLIFQFWFFKLYLPIEPLETFEKYDYLHNSDVKLTKIPFRTKIEYLNENGKVTVDNFEHNENDIYLMKSKNKTKIQTEIIETQSDSFEDNENFKFNEKTEREADRSDKGMEMDSDFNKKISPRTDENNFNNLKEVNDLDEIMKMRFNNLNRRRISLEANGNSFKETLNNPSYRENEPIVFIVSKFNFFMIKILQLILPSYIEHNFSEINHLSLGFRFLFHIPIILTVVVIVVIVSTFNSEMNLAHINKRIISKLPVVKYTQDQGTDNCSICLETFVEGDINRVLKCNHFFHKNCIDNWLVNSLKCPMCRAGTSTIPEREQISNDLEERFLFNI